MADSSMSEDQETVPITPRRGSRIKKLSSKAQEATLLKRAKQRIDSSASESVSSEENEHINMEVDKPISLFEADDVEGKIMYSFQTPKKRDSMLQKVSQSVTPKTKSTQIVSTPSNSALNRKEVIKTPYRNQLKKELAVRFKAAVESEDEPEEFEDSGSDFQPTDTSSTSESEEEKIIDSDSDTTSPDTSKHQKSTRATKQNKINRNQSPTKQKTKRKQDLNYFMKTDDYFTQSSLKKIVTSNHTLDKLETPRLPQEQLQHLLKNLKLSEAHQESMNFLLEANNSHFEKWLLLLHEGFSILLYGLGSKRNIVQQFIMEAIPNSPTLIVNGFFPSLSIKDILDGIMDFLELSEHPTNPFEACNLIEAEFEADSKLILYLIVHNIDGTMLRTGKTQKVLAKLADIKNIRLLATIDHINTPLLWDHSKISKFNFSWWDVTSFLPYTNETSYEGSMMVKRSGNLALSSLNNVFLSLTSNSKGIYLNIVRKQLENKNVQHYQGLLFKDLYWACREAFLVSSDLALRAQLTEFVDHKMVKIKRSMDGGEYLYIPIDNTLLQKFLESQTKK